MLEQTEVYLEAVFQEAVVSVSRDVLAEADRPFAVLEGFGLDVAVFSANKVRFLELEGQS